MNTENQHTNLVLDRMAEEKRRTLDSAKQTDVSGGLLRGGVGAAGGILVGTATVLTGAFVGIVNAIKTLGENPRFVKDVEKTVEKLEHSSHINPQAEKEMVRITEEVLEHSGSISKSMVKNPGSWVTGFTVAGAGLGLLWQSKVSNKKVEVAKKELADVEQLQKSWASRTQESHTPTEAKEV